MNKILLCFFLACLGFKTSILQAQLYGTDSYVTIYLDTNKVVDDYISFNLEFNNDSRVWIDLNNNQKYDEGELAYKFHSPEVNIEKENLQKEYRIYELSQIDGMPECISYQSPFRHLCNI